jgi:broad specificity phosphatase PhoE
VPDLLLLRHALSTWNAAGRWQGLADPALSDLGREQARQAGWALAAQAAERPFAEVVSSDLARATETADLLAGALGQPVRRRDPSLREYDVGQWSGLTTAEIEARWPGQIKAWNARAQAGPPGGETTAHFERRVAAALRAVAGSAPGADAVLVVAHGHLIRTAFELAGGPSERIPHLAGGWLRVEPGGLEAGPAVTLLGAPTAAGEADI